MAKSHVLSGLIRKRSELSGLVLYHQRQQQQAAKQLAAIDKSIKIFDPTFDLKKIKSKRVSHRNRFFLNGEGSRPVLEVLRDNPQGLNTGAIVDEIVQRKGIWTQCPLKCKVLTPSELLSQTSIDVKSAIVVSDGRGQSGLVCAEWLAERGVVVELATEAVAVADDLVPTNRDAWYQRLGELGVRQTAQMTLCDMTDRSLTFRHVYTGEEYTRSSIDLVVDWYCSVAKNMLNKDLIVKNSLSDQQFSDQQFDKRSNRFHAIGDCIAPRGVEIAMAEAVATTLKL